MSQKSGLQGRNVTQTTDDAAPDLEDRPPAPEPVTPPVATAEAGARATNRFSRLGVLAAALAALAMLAYAVRGGMSTAHVTLATLVVIGTQILPGMLAWRSVRPRKGWLIEDLAMGFAIGSVLAIGAQVVAGLTETPWISYTPILVAVVLLAVPGTRRRIIDVRSTSLPWWWSTAIGALFLTTIPQLRSYFRYVPLSWQSGFRSPHVDAYLHLALAGQLAHRGPTTFPWVHSESLAYHWFSHAWVAQISVASGAPLDEVLFRFMPVLMPIVVVAAIAIAAVRLSGRAWTGPLAAALALFGGDLNVFGRAASGSPIAPLSPSLALAIPMMVGAVLVLALRWNKQMVAGGVVLLPILCIGAAGTKGSTLPLLVVGLGLAVAGMIFFNRGRTWAVVIDLVIVMACLIFALVFVFQGSDAGLNINPTEAADETGVNTWLGIPHGTAQIVLVLALAVGGVLARAIGAVVLPFTRSGRRSPVAWTLIGGSLAGAGAVAVFGHPGASQWYFARTAEPLLAIASCLGLVSLFNVIKPDKRVRVIGLGLVAGLVFVEAAPILLGPLPMGAWRRAGAMVLIALAVLALAAVVGWFLGTGRTERVRLAGAAVVVAVLAGGLFIGWTSLLHPPMAKLASVSQNNPQATSVGEIDAARFIRDHSGVDDMVMTNRHCTTPMAPDANCDSRRFVVAAFSERQVLLEGWTATPESAKLAPKGRDSITINYWKPELLALNDGFIADPTADGAAQLEKMGVKWIFVDHTRPYASPAAFAPYATLRYQTSGVDVYEFTGSK